MGSDATEGSARLEALAQLRATIAAFDWAGLTEGRRQILEAFLRIATTEGYSSVTMRALGKQLNLKAPSLYSHFPDGRDQVVGMALRWHYSRWVDDAITALEPMTDARGFLDALIGHHVRSQLTMLENDMFDLLLATDRISGTLPPEIRAEADQLTSLYTSLFAAAIQDLGHANANSAAAIIVSLLDGVRSWSQWDGSTSTLDDIVKTAAEISHAVIASVGSSAPTEMLQGTEDRRTSTLDPASSSSS